MEHDEVLELRRSSASWALLRADNAPLVIGFLGTVFVDENVRTISAAELVGRLDDHLFALNDGAEPPLYPRSAKAYLDDWASPDVGWLRKFYPIGNDEPHFDATPALEKAYAWVKALRGRAFVGTESRLTMIFDLMEQIVFGAEEDPERRLTELFRRRAELDDEIERVQQGDVELMDSAAQRERFLQLSDLADGLLSDFREVETNLRSLDRALREQVTAWTGTKGELLDDLVGGRSAIAESDEGRSFSAFYDLLLSQQRQTEFLELVDRVLSLDAMSAADRRMRTVLYDWLDAAERTQGTVRQLSDQLRRFLDDQVWAENRRVLDLVQGIEARAMKVRDQPPGGGFTELDAASPTVHLPMERPLYRPKARLVLDSRVSEAVRSDEVDASALFEQIYVDPAPLAEHVARAVTREGQIGLAEVVRSRPLEQGLGELLTYLSLEDPAFTVSVDETASERVAWEDDEVGVRVATMPRVTFARRGAS